MSIEHSTYAGSREENERLLLGQLRGLVADEPNRIANLANAAALLKTYLADINWVGFYLLEDGQLVLGPFQGLPACVRIPLGRGVCGTAAARRETVVVPDVHAFPGHIACDAASNAEIVVPLYARAGSDGEFTNDTPTELIGVLDIDSPSPNRFLDEDRELLERFVRVLAEHL